MQTMTLDQLRSVFQAGGLRSIGVTAAGAQFFVIAEPRSGDRVTLATTRGKTARAFRDPGKAIAILHDLGARKLEVDTSAWRPEQTPEGHRRPDTAERQRRAHAAAAHDAWFRAEVAEAVREADDPNTVWISNEDVERESAERRAKWRVQAARSR